MSDIDKQNPKIEPAQWSVVAIVVAFAAGAFLYKLLMHERCSDRIDPTDAVRPRRRKRHCRWGSCDGQSA